MVSLFPKHLSSNIAHAVLEISLLMSLGKYLNGVLLRVLKVKKRKIPRLDSAWRLQYRIPPEAAEMAPCFPEAREAAPP